MVLVVREQARQEDRESKLCPFPFLLPSPERGKRSTQLEMAKRAHRKNVPIFCPTYRSKLDGRAADSVTELLHLSERDVSKKCATEMCNTSSLLPHGRTLNHSYVPSFAFSAALDQNGLRIIVRCNCKSRRMICSAIDVARNFLQPARENAWCKFR